VIGVVIAVPAITGKGRAHVLDAVRDKSLLLSTQPDLRISTTSWWLVAVLGGVLLALAGLWTIARGRSWPGMSARYERKDAPVKPVVADDPSSLWKSLDRGEDPTEAEDDRSPDPGTLRTPDREL
jgi:uncharacterized membrane protein (TIGR02234 family)